MKCSALFYPVIIMEMRHFSKVFSGLAADCLEETTKMTQTETTVKQMGTAEDQSATKMKKADTRVEQEETAEDQGRISFVLEPPPRLSKWPDKRWSNGSNLMIP